MAIYTTYDAILDGCDNTEQDAIDYAKELPQWNLETSEDSIAYANYIDTIDGIGVYYDCGADYYFFTDETEED
jgi:hypothetical protein